MAAPAPVEKKFEQIRYTNPITGSREFTTWDVSRLRVDRKPKTEKPALLLTYKHLASGQYVPFETITPPLRSPFGLSYYKPKEVKELPIDARKYTLRQSLGPECSRTPAIQQYERMVRDITQAYRDYVMQHLAELLPNLSPQIELMPGVTVPREQFVASKIMDPLRVRTSKDKTTGKITTYDAAIEGKVWFEKPIKPGDTVPVGRRPPKAGSWEVDGVLFPPDLTYKRLEGDAQNRSIRCSPKELMTSNIIVRAIHRWSDVFFMSKGDNDLMIGPHINVNEMLLMGVAAPRGDAEETSIPQDEDEVAYMQQALAARPAGAPPGTAAVPDDLSEEEREAQRLVDEAMQNTMPID
jgi:hypothetical protein